MSKRAVVGAACAALLLLAMWLGAGRSPPPAASGSCTFSVDPQVGIHTQGNFLVRVSASASSDVWAVGSHFDGGKSLPLAQRWNGRTWQTFQPPGVGTLSSFGDVAAIGPRDAWAVGQARGGVPMIERWDGSAWHLVPSPYPGPAPTELIGVDATSASNIWAVGETSTGPDYRTFIEHFDGTSWRIVPSPNTGPSDNVLQSVVAPSATDAWAVGWRVSGNHYRTLALHWNGRDWRVVPTPNAGGLDNLLTGVDEISPNDVWAVGRASTGADTGRTLALHWDGKTWKIVPSPSPGAGVNSLVSVAARSRTDVLAAGSSSDQAGSFVSVVERWNGTSWRVVASSNEPGAGTFPSGITNAGGSVWAVGTWANSSGGYLSLVERGC